MMGSTSVTTNLVTDLTTVRRHLLAGKLTNAWHELQVLFDEGSNDAAFYLARSVVCFFEGDEEGANKLLQKAKEAEGSWSPGFEQLYGQLLVEGAICKLLMRDTHADLVEKALKTAEHLLTKNNQRERAAATTYIDILDYVALNKIDQAQSLHQRITDAWAGSSDATIQSWKGVLDTATLRSLCEQTRLSDRLFASIRGQTAEGTYEMTCVHILRDVLQSEAPRRAKLTAVRIFMLGRVGAWS